MAGYVKLARSEDVEDMIIAYPQAFILLTFIAFRARRKDSRFGLQKGEALIGDYQAIGLTRQQYRTAVKKLVDWGVVTTKVTNKGTVVRLLDSSIYDINIDGANHPTNQRLTISQPTANHQLTTNKNDNKEKNDKNERTKEVAPEEFRKYLDQFWKVWGEKVNVEITELEFSRAVTIHNQKPSILVAKAAAYQSRRKRMEYKPMNPDNWFQKKKYKDEYEQPKNNGAAVIPDE